MFCSKCNIDIPSTYLKCPSCGQGFHGSSSESSFNETGSLQQAPSSSISHVGGIGQALSIGGQRIGGWLVLPAIFLPLSVLRIFVEAFNTFKPIFAPGVLESLTSPTSPKFIPFYGALLGFEILFNFFYFLLLSYSCYLFFSKSHKAPKIIITTLIISFFGQLIDLVLVSSVLNLKIEYADLKEIFTAFFSLLIWGLYFYRSVRVKNTFVN